MRIANCGNFFKNRKSVYFLSILMIAVLFRVFHLGTPALWLDEIGQVVAASGTWSDLFHIVGIHLSPPLDYMVLKFFLYFGHSDWLVRLPACLFGVFSIPAIYFFSFRVTHNKHLSLIAGLLLAFSPFAIAYSQEARMYSLFLLLSIISYCFVLEIYEKPSWESAVLLGVINGFLMLTHYFGGFVCLGELVLLAGIWGWEYKQFKAFRFLIGCGLITAFFFLPWLSSFLGQVHNSGGQISYALDANQNYFKFILNEFSLHSGGEEGFWYYLYIGLFIAGTIYTLNKKNMALLIVASVFLVGFFGFFGVTLVRKITTTRNLIFMLPLYLLVCSAGLTWVFEKIKIHFALYLIIIAVVLVYPVYQYHFAGRPDFKPDWKNAAAYLKNNNLNSEKVFVPDIYSRGCLNYYLDPKSDFVFMAPKSFKVSNDQDSEVRIITDEIMMKANHGQVDAWFVLPPNIFGIKDREIYLMAMSKSISGPKITFKTQGKGKPLEIYKIGKI
jgi:uncharacterized membrane protein